MISGARRLSLVTLVDKKDITYFEEKHYKKVNNYFLAKKIGSGSYSKVYLGIDGDSKYAVKRISLRDLSRTSNGVVQLEREIRLMRTFQHKNILKMHEVLHSVSDNIVYLVLDYADFGSIGSLLEKGHRFSIMSIKSIIKQISSALLYIHSMGYVHQDIKPANILLNAEGRALLADFGIGHSFMSAAMVVGTPAYQAPEALDDKIEEEEEEGNEYNEEEECQQVREEVWSLGVTLYQLVFNSLPYVGGNLYEIVLNITSHPLAFPQEIDPEIEELIRGMLNIDPKKRLTLEQVLKHPFLKDAPDLVNEPSLDSKLFNHYPIDNDRKINIINAVHCDKGYSFAHAALSIQNKLQRINAPYANVSTPTNFSTLNRRNSLSHSGFAQFGSFTSKSLPVSSPITNISKMESSEVFTKREPFFKLPQK